MGKIHPNLGMIKPVPKSGTAAHFCRPQKQSTTIPDRILSFNRMGIVAVKFRFAAIMLLLLQCGAAGATDSNCMNDYYRTKLPDCVDAVMSQLRQTVPGPKSDPNTMIGFLAQLFAKSPEERQRILGGESSPYVRAVDLLALYRAGLPDDARKFADENQLAPMFAKLEATRPAPLATVRPSSNPGDNDLLIGAYMASGDTTLIERILENFSGLDDDTVSDALRMGLMTSRYGPSLTPKGRSNVMGPAGCAKYQCKTDPAKFLRVMTLSSAFWALQSLAQRDEGIKKTAANFFANDPRMKTLLTAEQAAFGNYIAALTMFAAFKPDQISADGAQMYEAMSKVATAYENLEPARNVFAPLDAIAKSGKQPK